MKSGRGPRRRPSLAFPLRHRLYGLGSVFGKTLRDGRAGILVVAGLLGVMTLAGGITMSSTYGTAAARMELAAMSADMPPMMRGLYGNPVNVDTLGGFISWHYGPYLALIAGLWSILALSSTLAGEARRGSLEFAVATPHPRRSIALQKVAGHAAAVGIAMAVVAIVTWVTGIVGATFPDDAISPAAAIAFGVGIGVRALMAGSIAFAVAPFLGRGAAAGIAGAALLGGYVINSYKAVVPAFETLAHGSWFAWTADHLPLAGQSEWAGVAADRPRVREPDCDRSRGVRAAGRGRDDLASAPGGASRAARRPRAARPVVRRPAPHCRGVGHRPRNRTAW